MAHVERRLCRDACHRREGGCQFGELGGGRWGEGLGEGRERAMAREECKDGHPGEGG